MVNTREIPEEFWNDYTVDKCGNVYSFKYGDVRKMRTAINSDGYTTVWCYVNGKGRRYKVHRLVAAKYIPQDEAKPYINHIDGDKTNNRLDNLEYCTPHDNVLHAHRTGLTTIERPVLCVDTGVVYPSIRIACEQLRIPWTSLYHICLGDIQNSKYGKFEFV